MAKNLRLARKPVSMIFETVIEESMNGWATSSHNRVLSTSRRSARAVSRQYFDRADWSRTAPDQYEAKYADVVGGLQETGDPVISVTGLPDGVDLNKVVRFDQFPFNAATADIVLVNVDDAESEYWWRLPTGDYVSLSVCLNNDLDPFALDIMSHDQAEAELNKLVNEDLWEIRILNGEGVLQEIGGLWLTVRDVFPAWGAK